MGLGRVQVGAEADLCLLRPDEVWQLDPAQLRSQGRHTPFAFDCTGVSLPGRVSATMVAGAWAWPPRP
jgi:dihydroorotase